MVRGRPGSTPQTEKGEWFARLIAQGVSNSHACRIVGVTVKPAVTPNCATLWPIY